MPAESFIQWVGLLLALVCLLFALRARKRQRLIDNVPTSKTSGVFIGLVELKGTAEAEQPIVGYLSQRPSVYCDWSVEEEWSRTRTETYTDSNGHTQTRTVTESGWTTVAGKTERIPFYLRDDEGIVRVNPDGASIEPLQVFSVTCGPSNPLYYGKGPRDAVMGSDHRREFSEMAIPLHANIYVMGQAREREDVVAPEIARDQHAPMFLISTRSETQIRSGLNKQFWVFCVLGWLLCIGGCLLQDRLVEDHRANDFVTYQPVVKVEQGSQKHLYWPPQWRQERPNRAFYTNSYVIVGSSYLATWLIGWTWMAFNSMVDLRRRVDQAWANVDVELKRRHDLLPNLVRTTEGLRDYERHLQTELAALRAQLVATAPGVPGPDPEGCAMHVRAIIERYPELKADGAFLSLQKSLVETEQRIALARGYFNEIATFYNTRLQIVPDGWIARLGFMKPQPLISATNFERSELSVNLADLAGSAGRKDGRNQ